MLTSRLSIERFGTVAIVIIRLGGGTGGRNLEVKGAVTIREWE